MRDLNEMRIDGRMDVSFNVILELNKLATFAQDRFTYKPDEKQSHHRCCIELNFGPLRIIFWCNKLSQEQYETLINHEGFHA